MPSMANIELTWQGPIGIGSLPARDDQNKLEGPHIYLFVGQYDKSKLIYVGQSISLLSRLWEHYRNWLGLHYYVRGSDMKPVYNPGKDYMLEKLNSIGDLYPKIVEDVKRWSIFYAKCDESDLDPAEAVLIDHVMDQSKEIKGWECDNGRRQTYGGHSGSRIEMEWANMDSFSQLGLGDLFPHSSLTRRGVEP